MNDEDKLSLIKEAIEDWCSGKLPAYSAIVAISMIVLPKIELTPDDIEYAKELEPLVREYLND